MDMNSYALEALAREHLGELHARAERAQRARAAASPRPPLRVALGLALIRLGTRALGSTHRALAARPS
jgi:hypothetical protein